MNKFYITTPIYYTNAGPHLGHTYTTVAADVLARAHRLAGDRTFFLTGTDEHGARIQEIAEKAGMSPQKFTDDIAGQFRDAWEILDISYDRFIRTTEEEHMRAVSKALQHMYEKGDIYKGSHEGLYCKGCEQFKSENDLVDGLCSDHKTKPEMVSEESYMFKLSQYADDLRGIIERDELKIMPESRKNEVLSFYKNEGLKDISFSRKNVSWGIPIPWDRSHTVYVWADAFLNYLTGLGWDGTAGATPEFWPADVQLMSKDILRVHATIWPAMLLSLGLPLPKALFVHGFFLIDGQKMSKSLGNAISPDQLVKRYGVDATKYLLMSATPFGNDGDVSWKQFDERYNSDLANGFGNFVSRVTAMADGVTFGSDAVLGSAAEQAIVHTREKVRETMALLRLGEALAAIGLLVSFGDTYVNEKRPWETKDRNALFDLVVIADNIGALVAPFMPHTSAKIAELISWGGDALKIRKGMALFPRLAE